MQHFETEPASLSDDNCSEASHQRKTSFSETPGRPISCINNPRTTEGGRSRRRDWLRQAIMKLVHCFFNFVELTIYVALIALVLSLFLLYLMVAASTSFLWLPVFLICLPLLGTVGILLRYTRLWEICGALVLKLQSEPVKSWLWKKILFIAQM